MQKKIAVLVDFTKVGANALKYAVSQFKNEEITVVHVIQGLMDLDDGFVLEAGKTSLEAWEGRLDSFIQEGLGGGRSNLQIHPKILQGKVVPAVDKFVQEYGIDSVVMGTRDKYDLLDRWVGTISLGIVKTLKIPVYLIPRYAEFKGYAKIMVATDYRFEDSDTVQRISEWNASYKAHTKFLHIRKKLAPVEDSYEDIADSIIRTELDFPYEISTQQDRNISDSLLANAYNFGADLLIVIAENQTLLQSLLFKSLSKQLVLKSNIPVLFLYDE